MTHAWHYEKGTNLCLVAVTYRYIESGYEGMIDPAYQMSDSGGRAKRATPGDKYLEVMVVIDSTVVDFHGEQNTEVFVLALFNMVSKNNVRISPVHI